MNLFIKIKQFLKYKVFIFTLLCIFSFEYTTSNVHIKDSIFKEYKKIEDINKTNIDIIFKQIRKLIEFNDNDSAIKLIRKLENSNIVISNKNFQANTFYLKGLLYKNIGMLDSSLILNYKVLKIANFLKNTNLESKALNTIANIESNKGNYEKALNLYISSLNISQQANDTASISKIYNNIGLVYNTLKEYTKAIEFLEKSLKLAVLLNNKKIVASVLNNIGIVYKDRGDVEKSLQFFNFSLNIKKTLPDKKAIAFNLITIGNVYDLKNDYTKAISYYNESIIINESLNNVSGLVYGYINLGKVQLKQKNYKVAKITILNTIKYANQIEDKLSLQEAYEKLAEIYTEFIQFDSAYYYTKLSVVIKDSISKNEDKIQLIINNYDKQQKEAQIKLLLKDKELQDIGIENYRFTLIFLVFFTIILIFTAFFVIYIYKQKNKINKALHENSFKLELTVKNEINQNRKNDLMLALQNRQIILGQLIGNITSKWHNSLDLIENKIIEIKTNTINNQLNEKYINENCSDLYNTVNEMSLYIDEFRNFFRTENEKDFFELSELISKVQNSFENYFIEKNIEIQIVSYHKPINVHSYKNEIAQIVLSIINIFCINEKNENFIIEFSFASSVRFGKLIINVNGNNITNFKKYFEITNINEINEININYYIIQSIVKKRINGTLLVNTNKSSIEIIMEVPYE